ncbi:integration host factor subunit beta [Avibacterium paragallinarum]|uniref:Integration host factor subunit beta n=1 Tax=Avibacterium paragallinarum TaxID=728 RepID=A0A0F5ESX1_AVIPA|nr:integration host factor subunit beta [Avibacterium paragallinarum]AZI14625.1 integration host factor subunit beta [Avibacterium paragallinarum]KAA6209125.1 integration host factor subunit beta [Avibacterium paragallinarum]KKB00740.1 integration host factor subunit beta [Avibacterium paragallinarum]MEE3609750.1 integration host factor subunit beta [Avibacterium paragallinarum]MEE3622026.1 integration host factor subunit beta [Avibacterium paragallinarum]
MTKSELIERIVQNNPSLPLKKVESAVREILEQVAQTLERGERVEVRGFGSFSLHFRQPRIGRNPKTGARVELEAKSVPHFKAGKDLRMRVDIQA